MNVTRSDSRKYKIKPFSEFKTSDVLDMFSRTSPRVSSFSQARKGIKNAMARLRKIVFGIISQDEAVALMVPLAEFKKEAEHSLISTLTIIGHTTVAIEDFAEYQSLANVCLPTRGQPSKKYAWTRAVEDGIARHYTCMEILRQTVKSAPKYRKRGHDYCEDMLEMGVRVTMRPGVVRFTRTLEDMLGWPSVTQSGVLSHVDVKPKHHRRNQ